MRQLWINSNIDILSTTVFRVNVKRLRRGLITENGTSILGIDYVLWVANVEDIDNTLEPPPDDKTSQELDNIGLTWYPYDQVYTEQYQFTHFILGSQDIHESADRLADAWAEVLSRQTQPIKQTVKVYTVLAEQTTNVRGQILTQVVYFLVLNNKIVHPNKISSTIKDQVQDELLKEVKLPEQLYQLKVVGMLEEDAINFTASILARTWRQLNPGKIYFV